MKKSGWSNKTKSLRKVGKVMHEFKEGELHVGKSDKIVKNPKQAIAIALSEAGMSKKATGGGVGEDKLFDVTVFYEDTEAKADKFGIKSKQFWRKQYKVNAKNEEDAKQETYKQFLSEKANKNKIAKNLTAFELKRKKATGGGVSKVKLKTNDRITADDLLKYADLQGVPASHKKVGSYYIITLDSPLELRDSMNGKIKSLISNKMETGGGVDGIEYQIGDIFEGNPNANYEESWQLFKPLKSYVINNKTNKIVSIHKTPYEAIEKRNSLNSNFKVHYELKPKEYYKKMETGGGVKIMPQQGTLLTKDKKLKLDYKKNGNNFEFVVYEGETNPVANYTKTSFKKKENGIVTMDYNQFINYIYAEGYIDDKNYNLGGGVEISSSDKLNRLGIKTTNEFGNRYRDFLDRLEDSEDGEYVGYKLDLSKNELILIQKKGFKVISILDYSEFPRKGTWEINKESVIHYSEGGGIDMNDWDLPVIRSQFEEEEFEFGNGGGIYSRTMKTPDGNIMGKVQYNDFWKTYQVVIDGVVYEEFKTKDEAIENLKNAGFDKMALGGALSKGDIYKGRTVFSEVGSYSNLEDAKKVVYTNNKFFKETNQSLEADVVEYIKKIGDRDVQIIKVVIFKKDKMALGGGIPNNYLGKGAEEVWNDWTETQRMHFLLDHQIFELHPSKVMISFKELPPKVRVELIQHISEGQYAEGGGVDLNDWDMPVIRTQFEDEEYEFEKGGEITDEERKQSLKNNLKLKF